jgi:ABC-type branched-subunit amino acid transport system substrate-binding protein
LGLTGRRAPGSAGPAHPLAAAALGLSLLAGASLGAGTGGPAGAAGAAATPAAAAPTNATSPPKSAPCATPARITAAERRASTGITATSVTVGNVATLSGPIPGLFAGAPAGVRAYFAYVNAHGGVFGRKLEVTSYDDALNGQQNESATAQAIDHDFALVGSFSVVDSYGCRALAAAPAVPDVSVSLDPGTNALANSFSADPTQTGWELGPFVYFKHNYPQAVRSVGALVADSPAAEQHWVGIQGAMEHEGYRIVYVQDTTPLATDFTSYIIKMRAAGVQLLDLTAEPVSDDALVIRDMDQQGWHPMLVVSGGPAYDSQFVSDSGGASAVDSAATDGVWLDSSQALYLGQDAGAIPAVGLFDHWVQAANPGFHTDLYALFGWASAQLFVQALRAAGPHPTRGTVLAALDHIDRFDASGLLAPADPAAKIPPTCYILAKMAGGSFTRVADPPHGGYRCDAPYFYVRNGR